MKIALIGYGKMGHAIERIARERGHEIVKIIDIDNVGDIDSPEFASADVAIEFTTPATAPANVERALRRGVPVVCGSTGWSDKRAAADKAALESGSALLVSSNFSIGVHIFNTVSRRLASLMSHLPQYLPTMDETHHVHKLDHPSGTALTLVQGIIDENSRVDGWEDAGMVAVDGSGLSLGEWEEKGLEATPAKEGDIPVTSLRSGEVPGTHSIRWDSPVDAITITHRAKSRDGFALGAVMSAEWLKGKHGIFTIEQMMDEIL